MKKKVSVGVIILTYNEEIHIERCINSILPFASEIVVIDSYSTDNTINISEKLGAIVLQNKWENNHAKQLNWGLSNAQFNSDWILRIDADEVITPELANEIILKTPELEDETTGVVLPLYNIFMGRRIKRGTGVLNILRLFRNGKAVCENKLMDEHMVLLEGKSIQFSNFMIDNNLNNISWWTNKHNNYSNREMFSMILNEFDLINDSTNNKELVSQAKKKRKMKSRYARMPLFWRAGAYFLYRYILKGGFLEGKEGFLWHFLQGFWYRVLIDAKIYEIKKSCGKDKSQVKAYLKKHYNFEI